MKMNLKRIIITAACCLCLLVVYKIAFTLHVMNRFELEREELGQNFAPRSSDLSFSPSQTLPIIFTTNDFTIATASSVTNPQTIAGNFLCDIGDSKLKFMVLVQRENLLMALPGHEHLSTDQILANVYDSKSIDIYLSITPMQIIRSAARYKLKTTLTTTLCEQDWYRVLYSGRMAFVAIGQKALSIDLPTADGESYIHLFLRKPSATLADVSILNDIFVNGGNKEGF